VAPESIATHAEWRHDADASDGDARHARGGHVHIIFCEFDADGGSVCAQTRPSSAYSVIAWGGGAVFVISLLWFLFCYFVRFESAPPDGSAFRSVSQDVAMFSVFALHHSAFARTGVKEWVKHRAPPELERSLYTWVASVLFLIVCTWWRPVSGTVYRLDGMVAVAAYALQAVGLVVTIRAAAALDVLDLAGVRLVQLARSGAPPRRVALETHGLYGFVRHPLYLGWALLVCAAPAMPMTRALFALVSTGYLAVAIPWEERSLIECFGSDYDAYRRRVRWRMIPYVY
jgi:methanethiol S-methyltransferase